MWALSDRPVRSAHRRPDRQARVLVAPDSFKGGLSAAEVARHLSAGLRAADPSVRPIELPLADGGEGTVQALARGGARMHHTMVSGPFGEPVPARWAELGRVGYIELAQAAGHALVAHRDATAALTASTYGVGQLLSAALDAGCRRLVLTTGGCATTDGGAGMLEALGARLFDVDGRPVAPGGGGLVRLHRVDLSELDPRLERTPVTVACDVDNRLLGQDGAAAVFGPQKGAGPVEVIRLERALARWVAALDRNRPVAHLADRPGAGASGGVGFAALAVLGASRVSGANLVLDLLGGDTILDAVDLVVTGEGSFDRQTLRGKAPMVLARRAATRGIPVAVVAGRVDLDSAELASLGLAAWSLVAMAGSRRAAVECVGELLRRCGSDVLRWWRKVDVSHLK